MYLIRRTKNEIEKKAIDKKDRNRQIKKKKQSKRIRKKKKVKL